MKIKFDSYVNSKFKQNNILFETKNGVLYYKNKANKLQELPYQNRNLLKLKKILEDHPDNDDFQRIFYANELKEIQKQINYTKKQKGKQVNNQKQSKTKKKTFFGLF